MLASTTSCCTAARNGATAISSTQQSVLARIVAPKRVSPGKGLGQAVHRKAVVFVERECRAVERVDNDVRNAVDQNVDRADLIAHLVEKTPVRDLLGAPGRVRPSERQ